MPVSYNNENENQPKRKKRGYHTNSKKLIKQGTTHKGLTGGTNLLHEIFKD